MKKYYNILPTVFILVIVSLVYIKPFIKVGFMSDDFALIYRTEHEYLLAPFDHGHFAPIIKILFILACSHIISYSILSIVSLFFHLINIFFVYIITRKCMDIEHRPALVIALLFAINPAGMEALIWHCAIAYVILTTWILISIYFFLNFLKSHKRLKTALIIASMQILALLTWEWGILLFPFLAIITIFLKIFKIKSYNNIPSLKNILICLIPAFICLLISLLIQMHFNTQLTYRINSIILSLKFLIYSPVFIILSAGNTIFYKSITGRLLAIIIISFIFLISFKNRLSLLMIMLFFVSQVPYALYGSIQSRYLYLPSFFLYCSLLNGLWELNINKNLKKSLILILIIISLYCGVKKSELWVNAYREGQSIKNKIEKINIPEGKSMIIANLPDRYGPPELHILWRPYMWRNGVKEGINKSFERINTPDVDYIWNDSSIIPTVERKDISEKYSDKIVYEVIYSNPKNWRIFTIAPVVSE